jgi:hypothetical protein
MTFAEKLDEIALKIKSAADLYDLHKYLIAFEQTEDDEGPPPEDRPGELELKERGIDICELPTFGGDWPKSTDGVWSWDENSILVGEGPFKDWEIRERA